MAIAMQGDFSKPRPAWVIQSDRFDEHATVTIFLVSATLVDAQLFRVNNAEAMQGVCWPESSRDYCRNLD